MSDFGLVDDLFKVRVFAIHLVILFLCNPCGYTTVCCVTGELLLTPSLYVMLLQAVPELTDKL